MYEQDIFEKETEKVFGHLKNLYIIVIVGNAPPRLQLEGYWALTLAFSLALNLPRY